MTAAPVAVVAAPTVAGIPRRRADPERIAGWVAIAALLAFGVHSVTALGLDLEYLSTASQKVHAFFGKTSNAISFPPADDLAHLIGLTLGVVVLGTLVAALLSVPIAYLAAATTAPSPPARWLGRGIGVVTRAVPDVVIAFAMSLMFALGSTIPGVIAIGIHSTGMISKLFADAIEQADDGPVRAIRATGGSKAQEFWTGVFPQVLPSWTATTLHRFDINLRGSAILGYAGVGGLGYAMALAFNQFHYGRGLGIAIVMFVLCVVLELISSTVRRGLLGVQSSGRGLGDRFLALVTRERGAGDRAAPAAGDPPGAGNPVPTVEAALRRPWTRDRVRGTAWVLAAVVFVGLSFRWADIDPSQIMWAYVVPSLTSFWPPTVGSTDAGTLLAAVLTTLQVAFAAALASLVASVVIGSFAARNVAPNGAVRTTSRVLLTMLRGIPELIVALFLIVIVGLGVVPAFVALALGGIGLLGKLVADSFEEVPRGPETALSAVGATRGQRYVSATLPQGLPALIGNSLYLVDSNIRSATLLGVVGGGGIGYYLAIAAPELSMHGEVTTLVAILVVVVLAVEGVSAWLRRVFA